MLSLISLLLSLAALVVLAAPARAADHSPAVRASMPSTVPAPSHAESKPPRVVREHASTSTSDASSSDKVNINTADVKTLMTLPGVSRKTAQQIVAYRDEHGAFKKASELRKVDGVGETVWEKNRRRIVTK